MRHVARTHTINPHEILLLGTLAGAIALGRDTEVGSLTPGKLASLVALPLSADRHNSAEDILADLFSNEYGPSAVWFQGKILP
jgi:imidazolonepropionase-like amidohydrolase